MISRTGYLILGLLFEEPLTGYTIKKITELRFRFFWNESYGQIYPQLKKLTDAEYIMAASCPEGGRSRIVYSLTDKGKEALLSWIGDPESQDQLRLESVLKIYMAAVAGDDSCVQILEAFRKRSTAALEALRGMRADLASAPDPHGNHQRILSVIDLGIATHTAWKQWAEQSTISTGS